ncbi:MAG: tetratricopeptide repeat protein, partial [Bacteroidia bacterium]|nr:tetratricopeptide repeat protein [Bacteroidia bacterium]
GEMAHAYKNISLAFVRQGQLNQSLDYAHQALRTLKKVKEPIKTAEILNNIALLYREKSDYVQAIDYQLAALKIAEQQQDYKMASVFYNNLASIHQDVDNCEEAIMYYEIAIKYARLTKNQTGVGAALQNMGICAAQMHNFEEAEKLLQQSLKVNRQVGDPYYIMWSLQELAELYQEQKKNEQARRYIREALTLSEQLGQRDILGFICRLMGEIELAEGHLSEARRLGQQALEKGQEMKHLMVIQQSSFLLYQVYKQLNHYEQALYYQEIAAAYQDSLFNEEKFKKVAGLRLRYKSEKKEMENELLRKDQALQKRELADKDMIIMHQFYVVLFCSLASLALLILVIFLVHLNQKQKKSNQLLHEQKKEIQERKNEIQAQNEELQTLSDQLKNTIGQKEMLLKEIHHRVKNNLQLILSLLNLQSRSVNDEAVRNFVKEGKNRVKSMALIHQSLYESDNLGKINFEQYLQKLVVNLIQSFGASRISWKIEAPDLFLDIHTAIPVGLITNELVTNALKYAFPDDRPGNLWVSLRKEGPLSYQLQVEDDGVGIIPNTRPGKSLGLYLVKGLAGQLKGECNFTMTGVPDALFFLKKP